MERMSAQGQRSPATVPLARDSDGNLIEIPEGAVGWRIRRQTGGRPRLVLDSKKQPMLFSLDYTIADVEDVLAPGSYLLDIVDQEGAPLGVTIAVSIGMLRNAEAVEPENDADADDAPVMVPTALPNTTSDMRLVLEANVRATQMAFIHNQRTLEAGLRMAETLRDGVQVLASSQADWIKALSSARGFFRNAPVPLPPVEVKQLTVSTGSDHGRDDDEEGDQYPDAGNDGDGGGDGGGSGTGSEGVKPHWSEQFMPIISQVVMQVMPAINAWSAKQMAEANGRRRGASMSKSEEEKASDVQAEQRAAEAEAERAARAEQEHAVHLADAVTRASAPGGRLHLATLLQALPPRTSMKLMQVQMTLSADEQAEAMQLLQQFSPEGILDVLRTFDAASLEQCTGFLRDLVAERRAKRAQRAAVSGSRSGSGGSSGGGDPGAGLHGMAAVDPGGGFVGARGPTSASDPAAMSVATGPGHDEGVREGDVRRESRTGPSGTRRTNAGLFRRPERPPTETSLRASRASGTSEPGAGPTTNPDMSPASATPDISGGASGAGFAPLHPVAIGPRFALDTGALHGATATAATAAKVGADAGRGADGLGGDGSGETPSGSSGGTGGAKPPR